MIDVNKILNNILLFVIFFACISSCMSCNIKKIQKKENAKFDRINETTVLVQTTLMTADLSEEDVSRGTGVIISKRYILTAAHVCEPWKYMVDTSKRYASMSIVIDVYGNYWTGEPVSIDHFYDICLFKSDYDIDIKPAKLSKNGPNRSDLYYYIGYPLGIKGKNLSNKLFGYYAGELDNTYSIFNIPAVGGSSGGPIYNNKGHFVGLLIATYPEFNNMSISVQHKYIKRFIKESVP